MKGVGRMGEGTGGCGEGWRHADVDENTKKKAHHSK